MLDVDCDATPDGTTPPEDALRTNLAGLRAIVYTSPSHTKAQPRWRVLLPLKTLLPPKKHRALVSWLSENLVAGYAGCIKVESTGDPCRLGFVGVTKNPEDYTWWSQPGEPLDWTSIPLEDEVWVDAPLGGLDRSPLWTDRATAFKAALKRFATTGQGLGRGQGRTMCLWDTALALWWAWAAEDEDFVMEVLRHVNTNFTEPEDDSELMRKMTEAHKRAIGERRKGQNSGTYGWCREPSNFITPVSILSFGKRLRQRKTPEDVLVGEAIKRLVAGLTLSDDQSAWRGLINKCAHTLARGFPSESAERIAGFFRPSLATMRAAGEVVPTEEEIRAIVETRLDGLRKQREENSQRFDAKARDDIEYATHGERTTRYTKQEIETWQQAGVGLHDHNWILVCRRALFVFRNGTWVGPYTREEFDAQGYIDLAAASDFVRTKTFNEEKGTVSNIPLQKLLADYGSRCTTRVDLNCEKTYFNEMEHQLVLAGPARREISAKFHEEVDQWLRILTGRCVAVPHTVTKETLPDGREKLHVGLFTEPANMKVRQEEAAGLKAKRGVDAYDDYDVVCDWLACLTQLDHPCAALYLQGVNSVGKGLFADGIARMWKTGAISIGRAFDRFNVLLLETPLIWVDEKLPRNMQASTLLRQVLAQREFVYERKHVDAGTITGCLRMIFTANNIDLFSRNEERVEKDDMDAFGIRFVHVRVNPEASAYLDNIAPRHEGFVEKNMLAEHALWLQEKRWAAIKSLNNRFLVVGRNTNVSDAVTTDVRETSECCNAICAALLSAAGLEAASGFGGAVAQGQASWWAVKNGEVYVHANLLKAHLTGPMSRLDFSATDVTRSIASISSSDSKTVHIKGKAMRMRPIRLASLFTWCDVHKVFAKEDVMTSIDKISKDTLVYEKNAEEKSAAAAQVVMEKAVEDTKKVIN